MQLLFPLCISLMTFAFTLALLLPYTKNKLVSSLKSLLSSSNFSKCTIPLSPTAKNYNGDGENMISDDLYGALEKVTEDMALIEKEAMEIKEALEFNNQLLQTKSSPPSDSSGSATSSTANIKSMMVGADDLLLELKDKLTSNARDLQIIPIVGMGGSGKTTLALNIYQDSLIKEHCDIRAWVTVSLEYNIRQILVNIHKQLNKLESLNCSFSQSMCITNYPQSLKKLTLDIKTSIRCQEILDKIGALPLLEKLNLDNLRTFEGQWKTTEGQFRSLKFLSLYRWKGMQVWKSEASHFPRLEQLHLHSVYDMEEIPLDFAEISTLRQIHIRGCIGSVLELAKSILEEQEALYVYGEEETTLQIKVILSRSKYEALEGFESPNFQFTLD